MSDATPTTTSSQLSAKVLEYDRIVSRLVPAAKLPGFTHDDWAPLAELIAVDEFERIGILREAMTWQQYRDFLSKWAASKEFWTRIRRISEISSTRLLRGRRASHHRRQ